MASKHVSTRNVGQSEGARPKGRPQKPWRKVVEKGCQIRHEEDTLKKIR